MGSRCAGAAALAFLLSVASAAHAGSHHLALSGGYGQWRGGIGGSGELKLGPIGVLGGIGYFKKETMVEVGGKLYVFQPDLETAFGVKGIWAGAWLGGGYGGVGVREDWTYGWSSSYERQVMWSPFAMVGGDIGFSVFYVTGSIGYFFEKHDLAVPITFDLGVGLRL